LKTGAFSFCLKGSMDEPTVSAWMTQQAPPETELCFPPRAIGDILPTIDGLGKIRQRWKSYLCQLKGLHPHAFACYSYALPASMI
jgi:hypothetical protein